MITAVFRDRTGSFTVENIANIVYDAKENIYNVMFADYSEEEYIDSQLIEISAEGF